MMFEVNREETLKITVLAENTGWKNYLGEHGLSLFIEHNNDNILLDAGKSSLFAENAKELGVDLESVDYAVLSHSHYDHADGFNDFFEINNKAKLYVREGTSENYFSMHGEELKYIGPRKGMLNQYKDRIVYVSSECYTIPGTEMVLVPHSSDNLSAIGEKARLYKLEDGNVVADDFAHEQSLVIHTPKGLVIFNSCSHGGPANIIREVLQGVGNHKIYAYIGGFHLSKYPDEDVLEFARTLKSLEIERLITGHCTGEGACEILKEQLGAKVEIMHSGMIIEV